MNNLTSYLSTQLFSEIALSADYIRPNSLCTAIDSLDNRLSDIAFDIESQSQQYLLETVSAIITKFGGNNR